MCLFTFTKKEMNKLLDAVDKLNEQQRDFYIKGYNEWFAQGWRMGVRLLAFVVIVVIIIVWIVFNSPFR